MKLVKALGVVILVILLYVFVFYREFFVPALIVLVVVGFSVGFRALGNKDEPEGMTNEERKIHHLEDELKKREKLQRHRKKISEKAEEGAYDPIEISSSTILKWLFIGFIVLFVGTIIFTALSGEGYIQTTKKLESDHVVPIDSGVYNLKPRTGPTLDMSSLTYYKGEPLYYVTQQVLMCGFNGGDSALITLATNGDLTISNVTGVKTKVTTPPSLPGTVIVECGEPGVYLIGFAPKP